MDTYNGGMRKLATVMVTALLLAACTKGTGRATAEPPSPAPEPTSVPIGVLAPSVDPAESAAAGASTTSRPNDGEKAAAASAEGEPGLGPRAPVTPPIPCSLKATLRAVPTSSGPGFTLTLKNEGSKPLRLVVPGDGSEVGWRPPVVTWSATLNGAPATPLDGARCGMTNRVEANEIFTLAAGASREIKEWLPPPSFAPGTYDLRLTYRNDPGIQTRGGETDEVKRLLASSMACEVTSNAVRVTLQ